MTQPSFEYLEDKKVVRQVPEMEENGQFLWRYKEPYPAHFEEEYRKQYDKHIASLPTYPVITPTEQWEKEVRGRKDLKEYKDFHLFLVPNDPNGRIEAIPILPVQEEVKDVEESPFEKRYRELYNQAPRNGSAEEREYLRNIVLDELGEAYKNHPLIKYLRWLQRTQYKEYPILWNQVIRIVNDIIELNLLNSDQESDGSVASKAK